MTLEVWIKSFCIISGEDDFRQTPGGFSINSCSGSVIPVSWCPFFQLAYGKRGHASSPAKIYCIDAMIGGMSDENYCWLFITIHGTLTQHFSVEKYIDRKK